MHHEVNAGMLVQAKRSLVTPPPPILTVRTIMLLV
jgi:hypothetical protein